MPTLEPTGRRRPARRGHRRLPAGGRGRASRPTATGLLAGHPDLADRLRAFFADLDRIGRQASAFRLPDADGDRRPPAAEPAPDLPARPLLRRLRAARGDRPRRHGRRLQGPAGQPQPRRRPEDDPGRAVRRRPRDVAAVPRRRPRRRPASTTRTSCPSTRSASTTGSTYFTHEAGRRAAAWPTRPAGSGRPAARPPAAGRPSPGRSTTPTSAASCTATSSRRTSCSTPDGDAVRHRLRPGQAGRRPTTA